MGRLIVFEGINGAGKDTLITSVGTAIRNQDSLGTVTMTGEPWPYEGWEHIFDQHPSFPANTILDDLDNTGKAMLYCANRMHHIQKCIKPSLEQFDWVLCSRWTASTLIYQWEPSDEAEDLLAMLSVASRLDLSPDHFFWINTPPEVAAERMNQRGEIVESEDIDRLKFLHSLYEDFFGKVLPVTTTNRMVSILDGTKSIPDLTTEVIEVLKSISTK